MSVGNLFSTRNRVLTLLTLVAATLAVFGYLQTDQSVAGHRYYLENSGGAVLFSHAAFEEHYDPCISCHHDLVEGDPYDCDDCHDEPEYVHGAYEHDELVAVEDHDCEGCHDLQPDSMAESCRCCHESEEIGAIYHDTCTTCHRVQDTDRFINEQDQVVCEACHLK